MKDYTSVKWEHAEKAIIRRAEETAYNVSENIKDRKVQLLVYTMTKSNIILGARMMQEEMIKNDNHETQKKN